MSIPDYERTATVVLAWISDYADPLLMGAGATGALLALVLVWRWLRRGEAHARLGIAAVTLATAFAMEGMYEVARGPLGLGITGALFFCATFEVVMLHQGTLAAYKLASVPDADVSRHMRLIWTVAAVSGLVASTASSSLTEVLLRLATPPLAAGIWYMSLYADKPPAARQASAWIWTPQRIGIHFGLLKPGSGDDLTEVFAQRRVARMVRLAGRIDTSRLLRGWRLRRLRRLAETADAAMVEQVRNRYQRSATIHLTLFAQPTPAADPADVAQPSQPAIDATAQPAPPAAAHLIAQPPSPRRTRGVVMRRPVSAPPDTRTEEERAQALRGAIDAVLRDGMAKRAAAREWRIPESTLRTHLAQSTNGHQFAASTQQ